MTPSGALGLPAILLIIGKIPFKTPMTVATLSPKYFLTSSVSIPSNGHKGSLLDDEGRERQLITEVKEIA